MEAKGLAMLCAVLTARQKDRPCLGSKAAKIVRQSGVRQSCKTLLPCALKKILQVIEAKDCANTYLCSETLGRSHPCKRNGRQKAESRETGKR